MKIHYKSGLKNRARELRKNATASERYLWRYLRSRQMSGYTFCRQRPIAKYVVDFFCSKLNLVIEIDGITHIDKYKYDTKRENHLKKMGLNILRFDGYYVLQNISGTLAVIAQRIKEIEAKAE